MTAPEAGPWTVTIPAPAPWLSANQRRDLRRQTPDRRAWRDAGLVHARRVHLPKLQRVHIVAELRFPDNRRRDAHNYYPTLKALVDGLVGDYGLLPDDSDEHLVGPDLRRGPALRIGFGEVVLTVTDLTECAEAEDTVPVCIRCKAVPSAGPCCSSHKAALCHGCYRRTHFVEICGSACADCAREGLDPAKAVGGRA